MSVSCFRLQYVPSRGSGGLFCGRNSSIGCRERRGVLLLNFTRCSPKPAVSLTSSVQQAEAKAFNEKESDAYFESLMVFHINSLFPLFLLLDAFPFVHHFLVPVSG